MAINLPSPLTGAAVTGLTTPTYTSVQDTRPANNGKQWAITALGGTQSGVESHSVGQPFTVSFFRPQNLKTPGSPNPVTGVVKYMGANRYKVITRKGMVVDGQGRVEVGIITTTIEIPSGVDIYDQNSAKAMLSAHFGALVAEADDIVFMTNTGVL